jgi:NADH:ubiquinone oxidoreductase subunit 4 (subunit M)
VGGLAVLTAAITATYLIRMLAQAFFGEMNPRWTGLKEITWPERTGAAVLGVSIIFMGLWPSPWIDRIAPAVEQLPGIVL